MRLVFVTILFFTLAFSAGAQTTRLEISQLGIFSPENKSEAKIYFTQDNQLKDIIIGKAHAPKQYNIWRVQIYLGTGRDARGIANSTRNGFKTRYPEIDAEVIYHSPYFKVHVGNYKSRLEAESLKLKVQGEYPKCWVVNEVIKPN